MKWDCSEKRVFDVERSGPKSRLREYQSAVDCGGGVNENYDEVIKEKHLCI